MPYMVHADEQHQLVEVVYSGPITTSTRICAMEDGATLLEARQYARVLVDLTAATSAPEPQGPGDSLFAARMAQRPRVRDSRLAYVTGPEPHASLLLAHALIGSVASTRHAQLRHFKSRAEALHWLLTDS